MSVAEVEAAVRAANSALANGLVNRDLRRVKSVAGANGKAKVALPLPMSRGATGYVSESADGFDVAVAEQPSDGVMAVDRSGRRLEVALPRAAALRGGVLAEGGSTVVYQGVGSTPAVAVQAALGGVRIYTVLSGRNVSTDSN